MNDSDLAEWLTSEPALADGGMGTSLVERGVPVGACFEMLNVDDPGLVGAVHREFVEAGARIIVANTFGANRFKLGRRGLGERVGELSRAGVEIARRAIGARGLVAGSLGPLGVRLAPLGRVPAAEVFDAYAEQAAALAHAGADVLLLETQTDLAEIEQALAAARDVCELAVIVTATFARDDRTLSGQSPEHVAGRLAELGAPAIGVNCGQGPAQALRIVRAMRPNAGDASLVAQPNAGGPQQVGGRFLYPATPNYFAEHAAALLAEGVRLIGGCCGTGPSHVAAMADALHGAGRLELAAEVASPSEREVDLAPAAAGQTALASKLADGRFVVAVEVETPRGYATARMLAGASTLVEAGADVVDVADSPMARMRMSPWAACRLIEERVGAETVLHFPTRGRNLLRLQGDLLAVHALGIRNVFVCLGDPVAIGDFPGGTDNVDVAPTGLLALITKGFNHGRDRSGASIGEPTSFVVGCALNPTTADLAKECALLARKVEAGASFALSQPVYSLDPLRRLRETYEAEHGELVLPVLAGVLPLASSRHAEFLHNEVPGMVIPDRARDRLRRAGEGAEREGVRMAADLAGELRDSGAASGIYLMPQFGRFDIAAEVVEAAKS